MGVHKPSAVDPEPMKLFYRREEAAYTLGVPVRTIDYLIAGRRLLTRRVGRRVLIHYTQLRSVEAEILRSDMLEVRGTPQARARGPQPVARTK